MRTSSPANRAGRFGAPETEPGPSGVGTGTADGLMKFSFHDLTA